MISFSKQRFSQIVQVVAVFFCGIGLTPILHAQSNDALFRGTWQIDTPEQGALIMIVKSQGRASYFWGDNTDRTVYQGTWTSLDEAATLTWADGSQHRIERDSLGFGITYTDANGRERYTAQAQQVPAEILGQWAKPPQKENEIVSDRDRAKGFFGIWQIGGDGDAAEYVFVESDRSAASTEGGDEGLRGSWAKQGSELHIAWDSGHYSILRENNHEFAYKRIEPGAVIEDDASELQSAIRTIEDKVPTAWLANYQKEREIYTGGIAFSSRSNARAFYRGDWIVKLAGNQYERIEIGRFGGLSSSTDRGLEGDWRMQGQDIFMRWDDGMRKILSPIGRGFLLYEYKPGRPLDGVPTRIRVAAPGDTGKLAEHLKGREDVAQQMVNLAEAAGIDPAQQKEAGWGRTFARWAWPFGEDEAATTPEALLIEEYEEAGATDPWWWPFWSEKAAPAKAAAPSEQVAGEEAEAVTLESDSMATDAIDTAASEPENALPTPAEDATDISIDVPDTESDSAAAETTPQKKRGSARDWVWPF